MRKTITILGLLIISSTVFAKNIECSINLLRASSTGLMPVEKLITLKQTQVQKTGRFELKKCASEVVSELKLQLCGVEHDEAVGVFGVELLIDDNSIQNAADMTFTSANNLVAISKKARGQLVNLVSQHGLSPVFIKKMTAANLDFPDYKGGDSLQIDQVVEDAVKKGVLKETDIVTVSIESCSFK